MGLKEYFAEFHRGRDGQHYEPDPFGRLGQGRWVEDKPSNRGSQKKNKPLNIILERRKEKRWINCSAVFSGVLPEPFVLSTQNCLKRNPNATEGLETRHKPCNFKGVMSSISMLVTFGFFYDA